MHYEVAEGPDGPLVRLSGRLDAYATPTVEAALIGAVADGAVAIDCAGVSYISSAGLRVLLVAAKATKARGRKLRLTGVGADVLDVITLAGMTLFFDISPDAGGNPRQD